MKEKCKDIVHEDNKRQGIIHDFKDTRPSLKSIPDLCTQTNAKGNSDDLEIEKSLSNELFQEGEAPNTELYYAYDISSNHASTDSLPKDANPQTFEV